ncbi:Uncharacterised protein [Paenibacillus macerans]|uniref:Uncharacterized protein n=1 Tax=Paenibacillus macerans TaxID=44252 RepID=A0A090YRB8_PAEMA|nr:hypothetical protein DJ90_4515 [Paenibacillus macerans]GIP12897.1 hypothetical protein J1TS5_50670 [Paenibacillus macerans]SUA85179.1 Uncharacterised protein [Paenibacillus macerans]
MYQCGHQSGNSIGFFQRATGQGDTDKEVELRKQQYPEEGESIMELMPAWKRLGYDEG